MCEPILSDYGIVHETPEGSGDMLIECEIVPSIPNSSNDLFRRTLFHGMSESDYQEQPDFHSTMPENISDFSKSFILHKNTVYENVSRQCVLSVFLSCNSCKAVFHMTCIFNT